MLATALSYFLVIVFALLGALSLIGSVIDRNDRYLFSGIVFVGIAAFLASCAGI